MAELIPTPKDVEASKYLAEIVGAEPKHCWRNSQLAAMTEDTTPLRYVEGHIILLNPIVVIEHAWLFDMDSARIIDVTLPDTEAVYIPGLLFTPSQVRGVKKSWTGGAFAWKIGGFGGMQNPDYRASYVQAMKLAYDLDLSL